MKATLFLTALVLTMGSLNAQPREVLNLAPDGPADPALIPRMLAAQAVEGGARAPLNITSDIATEVFGVPSCANVAGQNGAFYKTELKIATRWSASHSIKVDMIFVPNGPPPYGGYAGTGGLARTFTLVGHSTYIWQNILASLGVSGAGYIGVAIDASTMNQSAYTMAAWANTYTASPVGGFYRTPVPVYGLGGHDPTKAYLNSNLNQDSSTRNNLFVINLDTTNYLTLKIYADQNGSPWGAPYTVMLAPGEADQYSFSSLFPGVTGSGINIQFVPSGTSSPWIGYTIRTDNFTNDGMIENAEKFDTANWPQ